MVSPTGRGVVAVILIALLFLASLEPLPPGAVMRLGETRFRAPGCVDHLQYSADGFVLTGFVTGADGQRLIIRWDANTGLPLLVRFEHYSQAQFPNTLPAILLPGHRVLTAGPGNAARVWDATTERQLARLSGHATAVTAVARSPDGNRIATGSMDGLVRIWDAQTFRPLSHPRGHTSAVRTIRFSRDGQRAVTTGDDGTARVWNLSNGKELRVLSSSDSVEITPDGLGVILPAGGVTVRDVLTGLEVIPEQLPPKPKPTLSEFLARLGICMAVSPDRRMVAVAASDGTLVLFEAATGQPRRVLPGHGVACHVLAFTPDGQRLLSGGADHTVLIWDVRLQALPLLPAVKQETRAIKHWETLSTAPADAGYQAMARFAVEPVAAVRMARMRLKPATAATSTSGITIAELRAIELLEAVNTPDAQAFLGELSQGTPDAPLTQLAKQALERMRRR